MENKKYMERIEMQKIVVRIEKLEKAVFGPRNKSALSQKPQKGFAGTKGGILLLLSQGYLNKRRSAPDVKIELKKNSYDYKIQVVQTALNRLSGKTGPLVKLEDGRKKVYVKRK